MAHVSQPKSQSRGAFLAALGLTVSSLAPFTITAPASAQAFSDIQGSWAASCISELTQRGVLSGYPDGTFRPNAAVTRAEFAAMVGKAFPSAPRTRTAVSFVDVPSNFWASNAINTATQTGFMSGYPGNVFNPSQNIPRAQVLVALSNGLGYSASQPVNATLASYTDAGAIPTYAQASIAAATERRLVVNYPTVQTLNPNQLASRAEVAAFFCQALTNSGQLAATVPAQYIAGATPSNPSYQTSGLPSGTSIPVKYTAAQRIVVTPSETAPLTLTVAEDVRNSQGTIVVPAGSQVVGQLQPATGGSQFVAQQLVINGQQYPINAASNIVGTTTSARDPNLGSILLNAAIGSAAATVISATTGNRNITTGKVLLGTAIGTAVGANQGRNIGSVARDTVLGAAAGAVIAGVTGTQRISADKVLAGAATGAAIGGIADRGSGDQVVIINPNNDLTLTLRNNLVL